MLGSGLQGSDIYYFPNLSWLCLPPRKNVVLILSLVSSKPPITSCWRLPGSWRALSYDQAVAWAQKDLIPLLLRPLTTHWQWLSALTHCCLWEARIFLGTRGRIHCHIKPLTTRRAQPRDLIALFIQDQWDSAWGEMWEQTANV